MKPKPTIPTRNIFVTFPSKTGFQTYSRMIIQKGPPVDERPDKIFPSGLEGLQGPALAVFGVKILIGLGQVCDLEGLRIPHQFVAQDLFL